jgi:hypothetical protein
MTGAQLRAAGGSNAQNAQTYPHAEGGRNGQIYQNYPHPTLREVGKNLFCAVCVLATITAAAFLLMTVWR